MSSVAVLRTQAPPDECPDCAAYAEEVAYLRAVVSETEESARVSVIRRRLSLTPRAAKIVLRLYAAKGHVVTLGDIRDMFEEADSPSFVSAYLCHARRKLGAVAFENVRGLGYRMTSAGMRIVEQALQFERSQRQDEIVRAVETLRRLAPEMLK